MQRSGPRQLNSLFLQLVKPTTLRGASARRRVSTWTRRTTEDDDSDFRPPWVYSGSRFLTYTTIPLTLLYCAFVADWGEREHIFMPLRRWVSKHKQSILSLSPEEAALVQGNKEQPSSGPSPQGERDS